MQAEFYGGPKDGHVEDVPKGTPRVDFGLPAHGPARKVATTCSYDLLRVEEDKQIYIWPPLKSRL